jgi:hypothetical protein
MFNEDENIENQAPNLFGLKGRDSFKTPKNYFSELEDKIMTENTSLNQLNKTNNFKEPSGYFNELPFKIESKLSKKGILVQFFNYRGLGYAASVAVIITLSLFMFNKDDETSINVTNNLLAENTVAFEDLTLGDYFDEITDQEINLEAIEFEEIDLDNIEIDEEYSVLLDEIELDPTTLICFDDEWSLFE